jgi:hypothetical protein
VKRRTFLGAGLAAVLTGCGYTTRPMYPCDIQTVYVPMFTNKSFRRGLEFQLTEAVIKEIELKTPYKVVRQQNADTMLEGDIQLVRKRVLIQTPEDEPRHLEFSTAVDIKWVDLRSGDSLCAGKTDSFVVRQSSDYAPELGQSVASASQETVEKLARQIVAMMEEPW